MASPNYLGTAQQALGYASMIPGAQPYVAGAQLILGGIQTVTALKKLKDLQNTPMASYLDNITPLQQNVDMWSDRYATGLPQSSIALAQSNAAAQNAASYRQIADNAGGQMANVFSRVAAMDRVRLAQSLAQMNDAARREAMAYLGNARTQLVGQRNMQTTADRQYRLMQEQALGGALRAGTQNLAGAIDYGVTPFIMSRLGGGAGMSPTPVLPGGAPPENSGQSQLQNVINQGGYEPQYSAPLYNPPTPPPQTGWGSMPGSSMYRQGPNFYNPFGG